MIRVGLIGFGCVGRGFYDLLTQSNDGVRIEKICVKDIRKSRGVEPTLFTKDLNDILENDSIDLVVELIDDAEVAWEIALSTLSNGKDLITANKKMLAEHLEELKSLEAAFGGALYYEGAVAGSIPIFHNLSSYYKGLTITGFRGILNGSTNYILSLIEREAITFSAALSKAKAEGFAESDPTLDISGADAGYKAILLVEQLFGRSIGLDRIQVEGIDGDYFDSLLHGKQDGNHLKLIASATISNQSLKIQVCPEELGPDDPFYSIDDEYNAIEIISEELGKQMLVGKGAGSIPTGWAVFQDLKKLINKRQASDLAIDATM